MAEQPPREDRVREREVIVTDRDRRGGGGLVALVIGVVAVLLLAYLLFAVLGGGDTGEGTEVDVQVPEVQVPDEVDVNVDGGG